MLLSYRYRLYPNHIQKDALGDMLKAFCDLYNAGLQQRIEAYQRQGKNLRYQDQSNELKFVRLADDRLARFSFTAEQQVLRRLDKSFKAFFRRLKSNAKPGFPRFRANARYHTADFRVGDGLTLRKSRRIGVVGISGEIKCKWHRLLPSKPASASIKRQGSKWFIIFHVEVPFVNERIGENIGIDLGLSSIVALSNGETIARPRWTKLAAKGLRRRQRALARAKQNSKRRNKARMRLAAYSAKIARIRIDFAHKMSADLVSRFAWIGFEKLNIHGLARSMLAKDIRDAAWAQFVYFCNYKAERAGGGTVEVDPRYTSQTCPDCGMIKPKLLRERMHRCECGCVRDRDVAAAQIVYLRAFGAGNRPSVDKQLSAVA